MATNERLTYDDAPWPADDRSSQTGDSGAVPVSPTAQKRKASSPSPGSRGVDRSNSPKRTRRDSDRTLDAPVRSSPPQQSLDRRQNASAEEKKRGKRLFGGLLSTLSRTEKSSATQKKRHEVERRQQAKVSQQKSEEDKHREARLAKLKAVRQQAQIEWDEQVMRTKHGHLLDTARFLHTRSKPRIYYLPWEPTVDQEDTIKDQIQDAEDLIEKEIREFKQRREQRLTALGVPIKPASSEPEPAPVPESASSSSRDHPMEEAAEEEQQQQTPADAGGDLGKVDADAPPPVDLSPALTKPIDSTNNGNGDDHPEHANKVGSHENDEAGDVMVEGDEDTVIY